MGWYFNVWLDQDLVDRLTPLNIAISLVPYMGWVAFFIALAIGIHLQLIKETSQGDGVYFKLMIQVFPFGFIYMDDLHPQ